MVRFNCLLFKSSSEEPVKMNYFILLMITLCLYVYLYLKWMKGYWTRRGLTTYKLKSMNIRAALTDLYNEFRSKGLKHGGLVVLTRPIYVPLDLEILRCIMLKNFDHFVNHGGYINEKSDPLSAHLLNLKDDKWKSLRAKLTPTFTSSKMKMMFHTMVDCTKELVNILEAHSKMGDPVDAKDVLSRFTTDVIGSVGFGIECNSLKDPENKFRKYGREIVKLTWRSKVARRVPSSILKLLNFSSKSREVQDFFINLTKDIIEYRESNKVYRKDFMHLLLQLKNRGEIVDDDKIMEGDRKGQYLNVSDIAAQCFVFFAAGFETSSVLMSFAMLELAQAQNIQDKLREELKRVLKKHGRLSYEAVMEMDYLDQIVNETLRMHPPAFATGRVCNKDFKIPHTYLTIKKGTSVLIPIYCLHHDPEYYPEPFRFIPERFSNENKPGRDPMTFMPFGEGPRMCIGARFGLLQSKVGLASMLANFKVTVNEKTKLPIEYDDNAFLLAVKGDVWLDVTKIEE